MDDLHEYVPTVSSKVKVDVPGAENETVELDMDQFHYILMEGDQLTAARAGGTKAIRSNSERQKERLAGLVPVCEDWHAKMCLLGVTLFSCIFSNYAHTVY